MFAEQVTVVGYEDDDGVAAKLEMIEPGHETAELFIPVGAGPVVAAAHFAHGGFFELHHASLGTGRHVDVVVLREIRISQSTGIIRFQTPLGRHKRKVRAYQADSEKEGLGFALAAFK